MAERVLPFWEAGMNSEELDQAVLCYLGTILRDEATEDATETNPVKYLNHRYFRKDGKWRCEYDNIAKLFHRAGMLLSGERDKNTPIQNEKILAAIAGQRFVLCNTPQADDALLEMIHHLA